MPANPTQAEILWYLSANYGVWAAAVPFWELPPEVGAEFLGLCQSLHPRLWTVVEGLAEVISSQ